MYVCFEKLYCCCSEGFGRQGHAGLLPSAVHRTQTPWPLKGPCKSQPALQACDGTRLSQLLRPGMHRLPCPRASGVWHTPAPKAVAERPQGYKVGCLVAILVYLLFISGLLFYCHEGPKYIRFFQGLLSSLVLPPACCCWVAVKELKLSYRYRETVIFTTYVWIYL